MALNGYQPRQIRRLCLFIAECEAKVEHQAALDADPAGFSAPLRGLLDWASQQSAPKLAAAYRRVRHAGEQIRADLAGFDAVIAPATATTAFDFADPVADGQADFTLPANVAGLAAAAFPVGMGSNGLPISLQVMARCDRVALAIAARFSRPTARPPGVLD
jgi:Asp-tRNA(Asn)/Glu-tRNA(Gln) amidotransferase A subunit family amidase